MAKAGLLHGVMQQPGNAIAEYDIVLAQDPTNTDALLNKAICLKELNETEKAREILSALITGNTEAKETAEALLKTW